MNMDEYDLNMEEFLTLNSVRYKKVGCWQFYWWNVSFGRQKRTNKEQSSGFASFVEMLLQSGSYSDSPMDADGQDFNFPLETIAPFVESFANKTGVPVGGSNKGQHGTWREKL